MIQAAQNQKQTNKGGLTKFPKFINDSKVMLKINLDVPFRLINAQAGNISHIKLAQGIV